MEPTPRRHAVLLILPSELGFLVFAYPANALPAIAAAFQTDQVAWLQTALALSGAASATMTGKLADRYGKRRVLLATLMVTIAGLIISAAAPTFGILLVGRVLQGASLSVAFLVASLIRDVFPARTVPLAVSLSASGSGVQWG
jgi:MFS family permease